MRERDVAGRDGFIAEGEVVVRVLTTDALYAPESLLLAENRRAALADVLGRLPPEVPVYVAPQPVMDRVVGFHIHRGVLAHGRRGAGWAPEPLLSRGGFVVGLVGVSNHDNVGGVFRNAAAFGASAVLLDPACCDPLYRKSIRVSTGSALRVPFARVTSASEMIELLEAHGFHPVALSPAGADRLSDITAFERTALLLGAEGPGLPDAVLARCRTVRIPMAAGVDSLNVAVTAAIVLHHLAVARF